MFSAFCQGQVSAGRKFVQECTGLDLCWCIGPLSDKNKGANIEVIVIENEVSRFVTSDVNDGESTSRKGFDRLP